MKMKLWILKEINNSGISHDIIMGFVVRAKSPMMARRLAQDNCGEETPFNWGEDWLNPKKTTCKALKIEGLEEVV